MAVDRHSPASVATGDAPAVHGRCEPRFEGLRCALGEILASGTEVGAALAVCVDKQPVVDLWGGHADAARTRPWTRDTIVNLFSVGKAVTAICAHRLVEAGRLDLDAPVARYWPEFAQAGKERVLVRHLLTHQAGLSAIAQPLPPGAWTEWGVMTQGLADQEGVSQSGQLLRHGRREHAGVARRVPSTNGHGNARAIARLYSALAGDGTLDGVHVLARDMVARASTEQVNGPDIVLERPTRYGLGFQLTMPERRLGPNPRAFGHFGAGGSLGFADPDARVAIGYAMNQGRPGWQHKHVRHLIDLVYAAL